MKLQFQKIVTCSYEYKLLFEFILLTEEHVLYNIVDII